MTDPHDPITAQQLVSDANDNFRNAFTALSRAVLAHPRAELRYLYPTDLLHDAVVMAAMADEEVLYVLFTGVGTHTFARWSDALSLLERPSHKGYFKAAFKVACTCPAQEHLPRTWRISALDSTHSAVL